MSDRIFKKSISTFTYSECCYQNPYLFICQTRRSNLLGRMPRSNLICPSFHFQSSRSHNPCYYYFLFLRRTMPCRQFPLYKPSCVKTRFITIFPLLASCVHPAILVGFTQLPKTNGVHSRCVHPTKMAGYTQRLC